MRIDKTEDLVIPMYNLLEYSDNYYMRTESLRNYYRDEIKDDANETGNNRINKNKTITSKIFEYKTKLFGSILDDNNILDAEVVVPLKYFSNFLRSLGLSLINCKIEIDFPWSKECIIYEILIIPTITGNRDSIPSVQKVPAMQTTNATFQIINAKLYVPVLRFCLLLIRSYF